MADPPNDEGFRLLISYSAGGRQYIAIVTGLDAHGWIARVARPLQPEIVWPQAGTAVFVFALPEE